jgi:bacterioferritin (cytochrome b1)
MLPFGVPRGSTVAQPPTSPATQAEREVLVYSYYRDAEIHGSGLLYRLLRWWKDPEAQTRLSEHLADETRHAWLWTRRIRELGALPVEIQDGYQTRIGRKAGLVRELVDLLALTVVVEQRALRRYRQHLARTDVPERTRQVLEQVTKDEGWHIDWIRAKGRELASAAGRSGRFDEALAHFRRIDGEVMAELEALERSWLGA